MIRSLIVVFGDQLDADSPALRGAEPGRDVILMSEVREESTHVPSHVQRTVFFLSAMRHFAEELRGKGLTVRYVALTDPANTHSFDGEVRRAAAELRPERIVFIEPGEHRVRRVAESWSSLAPRGVRILPDPFFLTSDEEFLERAGVARAGARMEHFYRRQRVALRILIDNKGGPVGGKWNLDKLNRLPFGKGGPKPSPPTPPRFPPDDVTRAVIQDVRRMLPDLPGRIDRFAWPVTRAQALRCLRSFIEHRLPRFGPYEDAMWAGEPVLYHSALSASLNLRLLRPRECVDAAVEAYQRGDAPLQSVEGFVRQIIGWREYIRGVYRREGPGYAERNHLNHAGALPEFYWTGETDMACLRACIGEVLDSAYGHHIQRLMVVGNFALIAGVRPREVADWFLGMYADAVDWATLPNVIGMSQHADGGVVGSKPYACGGAYLRRMSNYCSECRYRPERRTGDDACPFSTLYWDFIFRHRRVFAANPRMALAVRQAQAMPRSERVAIAAGADAIRRRLGVDRGSGGAEEDDGT